MNDNEFFDLLYSQWAKTTGAQDMYWMPESNGCEPEAFDIWAVDEKQERKLVAECLSDEDSSFITAIHGCLPDLIRRLHEAIDESDRLDNERDERENRIAILEHEADNKERDLEVLTSEVISKDEKIRQLESDLQEADLEIHYLSARCQDLEGL